MGLVGTLVGFVNIFLSSSRYVAYDPKVCGEIVISDPAIVHDCALNP